MELIPYDLGETIPELYATDGQGDDAIVHVKLFTPWTSWTWYVIEYDGKDLCFGLVDGFESELGYFLISELEKLAGPAGLRVERDIYFEPITYGELRKQLS